MRLEMDDIREMARDRQLVVDGRRARITCFDLADAQDFYERLRPGCRSVLVELAEPSGGDDGPAFVVLAKI